MAYRELTNVHERPPVAIAYGPFPRKGQPAWFGPALIAMGALFTIAKGCSESMRCDRVGEIARCVRTTKLLWIPVGTTRFETRSDADVRYHADIGWRDTRNNSGYTTIHLQPHGTIVVMEESLGQYLAYDRIRPFFRYRYGRELDVSTYPSPWALVGLVLLAGGIAAIVSRLRRPAAIDLIADPGGKALLVRERWGWRSPREHTVSLVGVHEVRVVVGSSDAWGINGPAGMLILGAAADTGIQLSRTMLPGDDVHRRAGQALADALEVPVVEVE